MYNLLKDEANAKAILNMCTKSAIATLEHEINIKNSNIESFKYDMKRYSEKDYRYQDLQTKIKRDKANVKKIIKRVEEVKEIRKEIIQELIKGVKDLCKYDLDVLVADMIVE